MGYLSFTSHAILFLSLFPFLTNKIEVGEGKKIFVYFIAFTSLSEIHSQTTTMYKINNIGMTHVYYLIEFIFYFLFLYRWENRFKRYWLISGIVVGVYILIDNFIATPFNEFAISSASLQNFFLFIFSAGQIIAITTKNFIPYYRDDRFYIAVGIFVYTSITALMFLLYNFFSVMLPFYIVNSSIICLNLFFTYSMVIYYRKRKMLAEALK